MLEIKNLTVKVKNNAPILRGVSLSIDEGTCIGLTGASGSGKTTLWQMLLKCRKGVSVWKPGTVKLMRCF